ncbi:hypothetical protein EV648_103250 [Kribbella sp. VKM Ac-2568]|nr:hypothetical protein EV648_103250 [Kribbella sp. VKM Ac-2568]
MAKDETVEAGFDAAMVAAITGLKSAPASPTR